MKTARYSEIKDSLRTGDLILFHGELLTSELTEVLQGTKWSHVTMVIRPEDIGIDYKGLLLWESNTLTNLKDVELSKAKVGPMLVDLEERVKTDKDEKYDNLFQVRYLSSEVRDKDPEAFYEKVKNFIGKAHSAGYPKSELQMFIDVFIGKFEHREAEPNKYFCSELIADTMINIGLLTDSYVPNSYMPKDFSSKVQLPLIGRTVLCDGPYFEVK